MAKTTNNRRLQLHIFLPYALCVMAIIVAVSAFFCFGYGQQIQKENQSLLFSSLSSSANQIDTLLDELDKTAYDILNNAALYPYNAYANGYHSMLAQNALQTYCSANSYLRDIALVYAEAVSSRYSTVQYVFTATGPYDMETFLGYVHPIDGWTMESFSFLVSLLGSPQVHYPVVEKTRTASHAYMLYIVPATQAKVLPNERGAILFFISRERLDAALVQTLTNNGGSMQVLNMAGQILYDYGEGAPLGAEMIHEAMQHVGETLTYTQGGTTHFVLCSPSRHLVYALSVPRSAFILPAQTMLMYVLPAMYILLFGMAALYALTNVIYKPIYRISHLMRDSLTARTDSLKGIADSVREIKQERDVFKEQAALQRQMSLSQAIYMLLRNSYTSKEELLEELRLLDVPMNAPQYMVLMGAIYAQPEEAIALRARIFERAAGSTRYAVALDTPGEFALLVVLSNDAEDGQAASTLYQSLREAAEAFGAVLTMSVGGTVQAVGDVNIAFSQAQETMGEVFLKGRGTLLFYNGTPRYDATANWYPLEEEESLINAIVRGEQHSAVRIAEGIIHSVRQSGLPVRMIYATCLSIMRRLMLVLQKDGLDGALSAAEAMLQRSGVTIEEFSAAFVAGCEETCTLVLSRGKGQPNDVLAQEIARYLTKHMERADLSLAELSERFHFSEGYLSKRFKEQMGVSIIQYLGALRLEHAQKLLRETELPLGDIITQCGYADKSNFIRAFKHACFVTPMQYRKIVRDKHDE